MVGGKGTRLRRQHVDRQVSGTEVRGVGASL